jgi:hypothetical protein
VSNLHEQISDLLRHHHKINNSCDNSEIISKIGWFYVSKHVPKLESKLSFTFGDPFTEVSSFDFISNFTKHVILIELHPAH